MVTTATAAPPSVPVFRPREHRSDETVGTTWGVRACRCWSERVRGSAREAAASVATGVGGSSADEGVIVGRQTGDDREAFIRRSGEGARRHLTVQGSKVN